MLPKICPDDVKLAFKLYKNAIKAHFSTIFMPIWRKNIKYYIMCSEYYIFVLFEKKNWSLSAIIVNFS